MIRSRVNVVLLGAIAIGALAARMSGADPVQLAALSRPATAPAQPEYVPLPPTSGERDLPALDRSVLPPADEKWDSPAEQEQHRRTMDQLWATKLGQMYLAYLTEPMAPVTIPGRANQIINQIFEDGAKAGTRVRVTQLLTQDMGAREKLDMEVMRRTIIFAQIVHARESYGNEQLNAALVYGAITTAAIAAPFGFDPPREEVSKAYDLAGKWVYCRKKCAQVESNLRRILDFKNFGKYHPIRALKIANMWFGPISALYFAKNVWIPAFYSRFKSDELLNNRDDLLENADF